MKGRRQPLASTRYLIPPASGSVPMRDRLETARAETEEARQALDQVRRAELGAAGEGVVQQVARPTMSPPPCHATATAGWPTISAAGASPGVCLSTLTGPRLPAFRGPSFPGCSCGGRRTGDWERRLLYRAHGPRISAGSDPNLGPPPSRCCGRRSLYQAKSARITPGSRSASDRELGRRLPTRLPSSRAALSGAPTRSSWPGKNAPWRSPELRWGRMAGVPTSVGIARA
jgi:hypothetical protein